MTLYKTLLRFNNEDAVGRRIAGDAHAAHALVMSGFDHLIGDDFFSGSDERHNDHRAAYDVLHAVNVRATGEVRVVVQSPYEFQWNDQKWSSSLVESPRSVEVEVPEEKFRYEITANCVKRVGTESKSRKPLRSVGDILQWWQSRAAANGIAVDDARVIRTADKRISTKKFSCATATLQGVAHVADASAFRDAVVHGIGQNKAHGCGLLLTKSF